MLRADIACRAVLHRAGCVARGRAAQVRLADDSDRAAFRAWFVLLADAQFERQTPDVTDCAALIRHAFREAMRAHTPEWLRGCGLAVCAAVRRRALGAPRRRPAAGRCFASRTAPPPKYAEFADARTLIRLNARPLGKRHARAARRRSALFPPAVAEGSRSPDGVRRPLAYSKPTATTGSCITPDPPPTGPAKCARSGCHADAASGAALAAARHPIRTSSASSGWQCYEDGPVALVLTSLFALLASRRSPPAQEAERRRPAGVLALDERGVHHQGRAALLPDLQARHASRLPRLQGARSVCVLRRARQSASVRQRRRLRAAGADVDRAARRLEARAAPVRAALRARAGQSRNIAPSGAPPPTRPSSPSASCSTPTPSRRCRCSMPIRSSRRGGSCCRTTAIPKCGASRSN